MPGGKGECVLAFFEMTEPETSVPVKNDLADSDRRWEGRVCN